METLTIDVDFDFTNVIDGFWNNFWQNKDGVGSSNVDPDTKCEMLQLYHQKLWSKQLPNGEYMDLQIKKSTYGYYLQWKDFLFSSDSLVNEFRWKKMKPLFLQLESITPNYRKYQEEYIRKTYTIGGMIIFPRRPYDINQSRGCNSKICDRLDLTVECIRRFYNNEDSPLRTVLEKEKIFFNLFVDFKGYIDFFFLQDIVSNDYKSVDIYLGDCSFEKSPLPQNTDE